MSHMNSNQSNTCKAILLEQGMYLINTVLTCFSLVDAAPISMPLAAGLFLSASNCVATQEEKDNMVGKPYRELVGVLSWLVLGSVTKPTPYSDSTHFSDHFTYNIVFPFVIMWQSGSCQAHWTATMLLCTWPRACSCDCQPHHVTVSFTPNYLLPYLWHTPAFSIITQLYL